MAFGRRPYTTKFRPFVDSDDEVDLIWYNAEPDAPVLGYPSKIQQLDNVSMPWIAQGVGEVFGAPRIFNNRRAIPFLRYDHVCGTRSDFETGGVLDPIPPDVLYDRNDIPICCQPPFISQGGGVGSGTATVTVTHPSYDSFYNVGTTFPPSAFVVNVTIANQEWVDVEVGFTLTLRSPLYPGNTDWELHNDSILGVHCLYVPDAPGWNGHGFQHFHLVSGPCVAGQWVGGT